MNSLPEPPTEEHWRSAAESCAAPYLPRQEPHLGPVGSAGRHQAAVAAGNTDTAGVQTLQGQADVPNILLYGPPGTGKTDIARTVADERGVKFIEAKTADLKAGYVGQSAQLVRDLFGRARAASPCVLFIDEIESVAAERGTGDEFTKDIVTQMLAEMEGASDSERPVIVLAATDLPEQIDEAIRAPLHVEDRDPATG